MKGYTYHSKTFIKKKVGDDALGVPHEALLDRAAGASAPTNIMLQKTRSLERVFFI